MGEIIRFPGAEVDPDWLDGFVWTPQLLEEYAARARALAVRYGSKDVLAAAPAWPPDVCQDCRGERRHTAAAPRRRVGRRLLCEDHAKGRLRVRAVLDEERRFSPPPPPPGLLDLARPIFPSYEAQAAWRRRRKPRGES